MNHDMMTHMVSLLGQFLVDNADSLAGKLVAAAPVVGVVASGFVEKAWAKIAISVVGSIMTSFSKKPPIMSSSDEQKG